MALIQPDFRRLLAFSSISHLGFIVVGLFALNYQGLQGSLLTMINLGFSTAGLFFIAGFLIAQAADAPTCPPSEVWRNKCRFSRPFFSYRIGLHRVSRHQRVCRRISDPSWRIQSQMVVRRRCRPGSDLRSGLFSLVLRTRHARAPGEGRAGTISDLQMREIVIARVTIGYDFVDRCCTPRPSCA